jgi:hypothetical protein
LGRRLLNRGRKQNLRTIRGLRRSLSSMPTRVSCVSPDNRAGTRVAQIERMNPQELRRRSRASAAVSSGYRSACESRSHEEFISLIGKVVEEANECKV